MVKSILYFFAILFLLVSNIEATENEFVLGAEDIKGIKWVTEAIERINGIGLKIKKEIDNCKKRKNYMYSSICLDKITNKYHIDSLEFNESEGKFTIKEYYKTYDVEARFYEFKLIDLILVFKEKKRDGYYPRLQYTYMIDEDGLRLKITDLGSTFF